MPRRSGSLVCLSLTLALVGSSASSLGAQARARERGDEPEGGAFDRCPDSPVGARALLDGCAAVDLVADPEPLVTPIETALVSALQAGGDERAWEPVAAALMRARHELRAASDLLEEGDPCAAARGIGGVVGAATAALTPARRAVEESLALAAEARERGGEDDDDAPEHQSEEDLAAVSARIALHRVEQAVSAAEVSRAAWDGVCAAVTGPWSERGVVADVVDHLRRVHLDGGRVSAGLAAKVLPPGLATGVPVYLEGLAFDDGTAIATNVIVDAPEVSVAGDLECIGLAIAPVQRFFGSQGPFVLHETRGYHVIDEDEALDHLVLDTGARLAAVDRGCGDGGTIGYGHWRYSLAIRISYESVSGHAVKTLATDLVAGDLPVALPNDVGISFHPLDTLEVTRRRQHCMPLFDGTLACSKPETLSVEILPLVLIWTGYACSFELATQGVAAQDPGSWAPNAITAYDLGPWSADADIVTPLAEGYTVAGGTPSFPTRHAVAVGTPFAVLADDPLLALPASLRTLTTGLRHVPGIVWPRVEGERNGYPFRYACDVPKVARDLLATCDSADTFYRLPFFEGHPEGWELIQGNGGDWTHKKSLYFAFDFGAPDGSLFRAARSGIVKLVLENKLGGSNTDSDWLGKSNVVTVEHEDGSVAHYMQSPKDGIVVEEGWFVERGQPLGVVGDLTSGGPAAVHFWVGSEAEPKQSMLVTFEAYGWTFDIQQMDFVSNGVLESCQIPEEGLPLFSNNAP